MEPIQADPLIGQLIERRYQVRSHLADGGMGRVYVAHDTRLERDVAFKVLRADLARDPAFVTRFQREARAAARLSHPHVVAVHDQGRDGDVVFLAMELVDGVTMRDVINRGGRPTGELLALFEQVLDGLGAAHHAGLVHRDIKPENILISSRGVVKIADFGLARAVSSARSSVSADNEMLIGTASYLAPEQVEPARFGHSGPRGDVYASALVPFICLGLALMLAQIDGWVPNIPTIPTATSGNRNKPRKHAQHIWNVRAAWLTWCRNIHIGRVIVCAFMGLVIANYVWILPILYGVPISPDLWDLQHWLPSW